MPSDSGAAWSPPASNGERRLSNSSDGSAGSGYSKATTESADFLATRPHTATVLPGKPAANPLQFIKVGPADLGCRAREQLRKAELAKRTEPAKVERQEDWQSNLDNWKSSRRKRVEHIIERCVEVRRMENEPSQPRAKSKTFNEMLEERAGRRRRNPLALYSEDDGHDLSDLGIGTSSTKSSLSEDCDTHSLASDGMDLDKNHSDVDNLSNCDTNRKLGSSANEYDTCTTHTISSPEPEEYTYEGAIEGYKSRIISQTNSSILKTVVNNNFKEKSPEKTNGDVNRIRTTVSNKIEEKLSSFQQERANDAKINNQKKDLPKVDVHKRREQFERENSQESQTNKPKLPEIANKKSIKERLSSLERYTEETNVQKSTSDLSKLPVEVKPLRERLTSLEKVKSASTEPEKIKRLSNGDLTNTKSLKERLSSLKSQNSEEEVKVAKTEIKEVSMSLKERLSSLDAAKNKEIPKISVEQEIVKNEMTDSKVDDMKYDELNDHSLKSSLSGIENQMQSFCRSLDSLDINGQSSPNSFERVQSFEDFDCVEMQSNTVPSDIETEDSGIHTARDSCAPADDIADLTQVASPIGEPMIEVSEYESSNEDSAICLMPTKIEEPVERVTEPILPIIEDIIIEEIEEQDSKAEDTDSGSNYLQAVSQPEELSVTEEVTEIQMDKEDEDTLKSLELADTSVSLTEPVSTGSDGDTVVFEGKMTIHLNLNEICNNMNAGAGNNSNNNQNSSTNISTNSMPMVTVSNIITTTNISPKNSIKTLKLANDDHEHTNILADVKCIPNSSSHTPIKVNCSSFKNATSINHSTTSCNNSDVTKCSRLTDSKNEPSVIDALDLAFQELDSEDSFANTSNKMADKQPTDSKTAVAPLYENIELFYQSGVDGAAAFPLDLPTNVLEPPKEKPPPPPVEASDDDELLGHGNFKHTPHTSSARRIKKEIRNKRTSFLGIEGQDDSYLDVDLTLAPRPDITSFLQEETKIEKLLYKKTLSHDMDEKLRESRDSGVDFDRGPSAEAWYKGQSSPDTSNPHSRQNSEPYTHMTSDEEEASKKKQQFNSSLTTKLSDLTDGQTDKIDCLDKKLQHQQACHTNEDWPDGLFDDSHTKEVLRFERELLQLEQEELRRQRDNLLRDQSRIMQKSVQDISTVSTPEKPQRKVERNENYRHSMPNLLVNETLSMPVEKVDEDKRKPFVSEEHIQRHFGVEESRKVLYEEKMSRQVPPRPPQPILPPKPKSRESLEREITMRSSRVPSAADYVNVERPQPRQHASANYQSMSRHTLQALSAAPPNKLISNADWLQRQPKKPASYYNQHWLIQEAEQRRLDEARIKLRNMQRLSRDNTQLSQPVQESLRPRPEPRIKPNLDHIKPNLDLRTKPILEPHMKPSLEPHVKPNLERTKPNLEPISEPRVEAPLQRQEDKMLSVSGKRKCSHCGEELGRGSAMVIESLSLCYHVWCFTCGVCGVALGSARAGADVRVRARRLHCQHCYSSDDGRKYSAV